MPELQLDQALTDHMVQKAVGYCAQKKFAGDSQQTLIALRQGQCEACGFVTVSLVQQVGELLGQFDRTVKAVYLYEPEDGQARLQAVGSSRPARKSGINLVAWVERKSAALNALGATIEGMLSESRRKIGCPNATPACFSLDVQMVDDRDLQEHRGLSLVVQHMFLHSLPIWKRAETGGTEGSARTDRLELLVGLDPELAPECALFEQALALEKLPPPAREEVEPHLREYKVALIRKVISDQLAYIHIAKDWFSVADLYQIYQHRIGNGRIGGKAAGLMLAAKILQKTADEATLAAIQIPESYFLGSDLIYIFMAMNGLMHWNDQKYKPEERIREEYPQIKASFEKGRFPPEVVTALSGLLDQIGRHPVIVRSSSMLEDNFGTSFAGKYDSHFCPNQGTPEENLAALTRAIALTYASTLKPEALLYRRSKGLQDYDERMSVMIQPVQGCRFERYFLPLGAGVAFSRNMYRWAPQIRREDGFARMVWGLGTRAVERVGNDYPRLVALSHPTLQPDDSPEAIRYYSQKYIDLIDLEENAFKTMPVSEVINPCYPGLRFIAQVEEDGYFSTPRGKVLEEEIPRLAVTYDELLRRTPFAVIATRVLKILEEHYRVPVDLEFTIQLPEPEKFPPRVQISLLQCRPQSHLHETQPAVLPKDLHPDKIVMCTHFMVPQGYVGNIRSLVFVTPEGYFTLSTPAARNELSRAIATLNAAFQPKTYLLVGPGRWGTTNADLGVYVNYADIYNAGALIEVCGKSLGVSPEPSLGTHFFQDLMEAQIYPLAIDLDDPKMVFARDFFYDLPNHLTEHVEVGEEIAACLRVINVADFLRDHHMDLVMDDTIGQAVAYLAPD